LASSRSGEFGDWLDEPDADEREWADESSVKASGDETSLLITVVSTGCLPLPGSRDVNLADADRIGTIGYVARQTGHRLFFAGRFEIPPDVVVSPEARRCCLVPSQWAVESLPGGVRRRTFIRAVSMDEPERDHDPSSNIRDKPTSGEHPDFADPGLWPTV
jgi:hypothetical protein